MLPTINDAVHILVIYLCFIFPITLSLLISSLKSPFIYTTCNPGSEKLLKAEILSNYPTLRLAYSRPGLITWKCPEMFASNFKLSSTFTRSYGISLGSCSSTDEVLTSLQSFSDLLEKEFPLERINLHVSPREGSSNEHPDAIKEKLDRCHVLKHEIRKLSTNNRFNILSDEESNLTPLRKDEYVFNIIVNEPDEKIFLGYFQYNKFHSPFAGGNPCIVLPAEAPSRAYLKVEEAIAWGNIPVKTGDIAMEIGSAPGGACYSLLQRGLKVYGVDPCYTPDRQHDPVVLANPNFSPIKARLESLPRDLLPEKIDWLLCDANIAFETALPNIKALVVRYKPTIKGILFTAKCGDKVWGTDLIKSVDLIKSKFLDMEMKYVASTQLPSNRQEIFFLALSSRGIKANKV